MRIAITGGIAEGKSTVARHLASCGQSVASADAFAKDALWHPIVQEGLREISGEQGEVSPLRLREILVSSPEKRRAVNLVMHPVIMDSIQDSESTFVEIPLLFETCLHLQFDVIWVVTCGPIEQRRRIEERYGKNAWESILGAQFDSASRLAFADSVIRTDVNLEETEQIIEIEAKRYGLPLVK